MAPKRPPRGPQEAPTRSPRGPKTASKTLTMVMLSELAHGIHSSGAPMTPGSAGIRSRGLYRNSVSHVLRPNGLAGVCVCVSEPGRTPIRALRCVHARLCTRASARARTCVRAVLRQRPSVGKSLGVWGRACPYAPLAQGPIRLYARVREGHGAAPELKPVAATRCPSALQDQLGPQPRRA